MLLCCSRKYPYPSHGRFLGFNTPTPVEIPVKPHTLLFKFWLLRSPIPPRRNFQWPSMGWVWIELHISFCKQYNGNILTRLNLKLYKTRRSRVFLDCYRALERSISSIIPISFCFPFLVMWEPTPHVTKLVSCLAVYSWKPNKSF